MAARRFLLGLQVLAIIVFSLAWVYSAVVLTMVGPARYTALDRAGVINEQTLQEAFPELAGNPRYDVGHWIAGSGPRAAKNVALIGLAFSIVSWLTVYFWIPPKQKSKSDATNIGANDSG